MENNEGNGLNFKIISLGESKPTEIKNEPKNGKFSNVDFLSKDTNLNIKVIGVGGAGCNIVNHLKKSVKDITSFASLYAFNTDAWSLKRASDIENLFIIDKANLKGYGSNGDPFLAKEGIDHDSETIKLELKGTDVLFLVTGFGKGTGSGATPELAKIASELGILTIAIVGMPSITCEGKEIYNNAFTCIEELKKYADSITTICNERIVSNNPGINFFDLYNKANNEFTIIISHIINMVMTPSQMNIDFSDVRSFFKNNKFFMLNHLLLDDSRIVQDKLNESILKQINTNISDVNVSKAKHVIAKLNLSQTTSNDFIVSFKKACRYALKNDNLKISLGVDYSDNDSISLTYVINATDELADLSDHIKETSTKPQVEQASSNEEIDEYATLLDDIKIALMPTKDLQAKQEADSTNVEDNKSGEIG